MDALPAGLPATPPAVADEAQNTTLSEANDADPRPADALDSGEKIELEAFLQRKEWIEDKCKLLERMPPIEVFAGLEQLLLSEPVNGLPSRKQLADWLVEHDAIEKEAEQFDSGDMIRLKKFAKAATEKHLSPADTDLIEVTLNTLLGLDKLLHLLRARGDTLELLGLRLTWEEQRIGGWKERTSLLDELRDFLVTRARWSPAAYERFATPNSSGSAPASGDAAVLDRSLRYKHTELLSHDAAQFTGKVISLRNAHVNPAGKTLDRLIEASTKGPVPDQILDEQDRVEDQCINELEGLGKFAINTVMQWKRADELYGELKKDQLTAETLESEIRNALLGHPTLKLDTAFSSRTQQLVRRLQFISDPRAATSSFPRPVHALFPDQMAANDSIANLLSNELRDTVKRAKAAEAKAAQYHLSLVAVQRVENAREKIAECQSQLNEVIRFLQEGDTSQQTGGPPDLSLSECLSPLAHSAFLAMLPSVLSRIPSLELAASKALSEADAGLMTLPTHGIDSAFRQATNQEMQELSSTRARMLEVKSRILALVSDLKTARQLSSTTMDVASELDLIREDILSELKRQQYHGRLTPTGVPLTPESPPKILVDSARNAFTPEDALERLRTATIRTQQEVLSPLHQLTPRVPPALATHMDSAAQAAQEYAARVTSLVDLWRRVSAQSHAMTVIHRDASHLGQAIDDTRQGVCAYETQVLSSTSLETPLAFDSDEQLAAIVAQHHRSVEVFLGELPTRVTFVQQSGITDDAVQRVLVVPNADVLPRAQHSRQLVASTPDLATIDSAVRGDTNGLAMSLSGNLQSLDRAMERLHVVRLAGQADTALSSWTSSIRDAENALQKLKIELADVTSSSPEDRLARLESLRGRIAAELDARRGSIGRSRSPVREAVEKMQTAAAAIGSMSLEGVIVRRVRQFEEAGRRLDSLDEGISALREQCAEAHIVELERLQELDRLQREEQERLRLEEEERRRQAEEHERLRREEEERCRQEEERKKAEEEERLRREEEERARLVREEEERKLREEEERLRLEEEERRQREEELRQQEEAERLRREEEVRLRHEHEEKLQREKEELLRAEAEAKAQEERRQHDEELRRLREDQERLQRELDTQREEAERLRQDELERKRREEEENERRDQLAELDWQREQDYDDRARVDYDDALNNSNGVAFPESTSHESNSRTTANRLLAELEALRIPFLAEPSAAGTLPSGEDVQAVHANFKTLDADISNFLSSVAGDESDEVLQLRAEHQRCLKLLLRLDVLGTFSDNVLTCDNALSDLLEHIDSYPTAPIRGLAASHRSDPRQPPKDQLESRITFTKDALEDLQAVFNKVSDDPRAVGETERINQTWTELYDMGTDCLSGRRSPAPSTVDSIDSASSTRSRPVAGPPVPMPKKGSNLLGHGRPSQSHLLTPRRTTSKGALDLSRPTSKMSMRSASGPLAVSSNFFKPTFSSRQRTTSTSSQVSQAQPGQRDVSSSGAPRSVSRTSRRIDSTSTVKPQEPPRSTFSRAPRFSTASRTASRAQPKRKTYVPNAKSKLDVAVGDVLNKLPEEIAIHMEPVGWQDNSGKYWIGDQDPKLCFCRILRSQTVMVRVGGGWMELSRFIKNHFANLYRLMPELDEQHRRVSVPADEKWISSKTLLQSLEQPMAEGTTQGWQPPRTPEPELRRSSGGVPSFSISSPSATSPRSLPSSGGSPLTPLQFMRRAEDNTVVPTTPGSSRSTPRKSISTNGPVPSMPNGLIPSIPNTPQSLSRHFSSTPTPSSNPPMAPGRIWRP